MSPLRSYRRMSDRSDKQRAADESEYVKGEIARVWERSGRRCEVELDGVKCSKAASGGQHHVKKRSQGGDDSRDNRLAICWEHHDRADWPFTRGRLWIEALGNETFRCAIVFEHPKRRLSDA